jgi:cell division protein FtsB
MATARKRPSHKKEIYYISIIAVVVGAGYLSFWGPGGYKELKKAQAELAAQRLRVETLQHANEQRLDAIKALRSDRDALERYARRKGYGRKGEVVQQLPQQPSPPQKTQNPESRIQNPE